MMKKITNYLMLTLFTMFSLNAISQCIPANTRPVFGTVTGSTGVQTFTNVPTGNVVRITAPAAGISYNISMCQTNGGVAQADGVDDSQITILDVNSSAAVSQAFNDDFCPTTGANGYGPSELNYTSTAAGDIFIYLTEWNSGGTVNCIADGVNSSFVMTITKSTTAPPCDAGVLTTIGSPFTVCPVDSFTVSTDGSEVTPNDFAILFTPLAGATGAGGTAFNLTGVTFPYTGNNDLNGVLSGQTTPLPALLGQWSMKTVARDGTNVACSTSIDSIIVNFVPATNPVCGPPPPCDAGVLTTIGSPFTVCPVDSFTVSTDGSEVTPNDFAILFTPLAGATGATGAAFNLTGVTFPYTGNNDLNGVLSGQTTPLPALLGQWSMKTVARDGGNVSCSISIDSIIVNFVLATDPSCGPPPTCSAGVLTTVGSPFTNCPIDSFTVVTDGSEVSTGDFVIGFTPLAGASGANGVSFTLTGVTFPFTANSDLNGVLSGQTTPLPVLLGQWSIRTGARDAANAICDVSSDSIIVDFLLATDPACSVPCNISSVIAGIQTPCVSATNTYTQEVIVTYTNAPATGMLNVNGQMFALGTSPQTIILTNLTSDGLPVNVTAMFTAEAVCTMTANSLFTAPASCAVIPCNITSVSTGTQTPCVSATNTYTQEVIVTYTNAPATGMLNVNGQMFALGTSPQTIILTNLTSDGLPVNVTAMFTAEAVCTMTANSLFTAPASCACVPFVVTDVITADTCGTNTGVVDVTISGGTGMISYAWSNLSTNEDLTNVSAGAYYITISDAANCNEIFYYTVPSVGVSPVLTSSNVAVSNCINPNGSATVTVVSANAMPYSYSWNDAALQTTAMASSLTAGNYIVTVTDGWGCTATSSESVTNTTGFTALIDGIPSDATCFGTNDGIINTTVIGGSGSFSYTWTVNSNSITTSAGDRNDLLAGDYSIVVNDLTSSCTYSLGPITINQPDEIIVSPMLVQDISCNGANDGEVSATSVGGQATLSYAWSDGNGNTRNVQNPNDLTAGTWTVTASDGTCSGTSTSSIIITEPTLMVVVASMVSNISCFGANDGAVNASVTGATSAIDYSWSDGNGNFRTTQNPNDLTPGTWILTIIVNGCSVMSNSIIISEPIEIVATATFVSNISCFGMTDGNASSSVTGGQGIITYVWSDGNGNVRNIQNPNDLTAGTWTVIASDANCNSIISNSIMIEEPLVLSVTSSTVYESNTGNDGTATVMPSGGTPNYTYAWSNGQTTATAIGLVAANYTCTIIDANGCMIIETVVVEQTPNAIRNLSISKLMIFPNPNAGVFTVQFETSTTIDVEISLLNTIGKRVYINSFDNVQGGFVEKIEMKDLSSGIYFLEIKDENTKTVRKITISK